MILNGDLRVIDPSEIVSANKAVRIDKSLNELEEIANFFKVGLDAVVVRYNNVLKSQMVERQETYTEEEKKAFARDVVRKQLLQSREL